MGQNQALNRAFLKQYSTKTPHSFSIASLLVHTDMVDALVRALESFFVPRYRILPNLACFRGLRMRPTARYEAKSENSSFSPHLSAPPALHMLPHICEGVFRWLIVVSLPTSLYLLPLCLHFSSSWRFMRYESVLRGKGHPELNARLSVRRKFCLRVASCKVGKLRQVDLKIDLSTRR